MEPQPQLNAHNKQEYPPAHTAEHLLNQTMVRMFGCGRSRDAHVERKKSKLNYELLACPTPEQVTEIERRINEQIERHLPVTMEYVTRDNVPPEVSLDKLPSGASETLRLVRVGDYDVCACLGSHVSNTAEVGHLRISSTSWTPRTSADVMPTPYLNGGEGHGGTFRIVFRLDNPDPKY